MKIQYIGGQSAADCRDILDSRYNFWQQGEIKEVPDFDIDVTNVLDLGTRRNAIEAVLNHGPHFVDVATGKNPLFVCAKCGADALDEFFKPADDTIEYAHADGSKACMACFLIANPQHIEHHDRRGHYGLPNDVRVKLADAGLIQPRARQRGVARRVPPQFLAAKPVPSTAAAVATPPPAPVPPVAAEEAK